MTETNSKEKAKESLKQRGKLQKKCFSFSTLSKMVIVVKCQLCLVFGEGPHVWWGHKKAQSEEELMMAMLFTLSEM